MTGPGDIDDAELQVALTALLHEHGSLMHVDATVGEAGEAMGAILARELRACRQAGDGIAIAVRLSALMLTEALDYAEAKLGPRDGMVARRATRQMFDDLMVMAERAARAPDLTVITGGAQPGNVVPLFQRLAPVASGQVPA